MHDEQKANQRAALAVSCVGSFMTPYLSSAVSIALPAIGKEFDLNAISLGWVNTAFLVTAAALLLPFGKLGDMIGRKLVFLIGIVLYTLLSALAALAPNGGVLVAVVALIGAAAAMISGPVWPSSHRCIRRPNEAVSSASMWPSPMRGYRSGRSWAAFSRTSSGGAASTF